MIVIIPLVLAALYLVAAAWLWRSEPTQLARRRGILAALAGVAVATPALAFTPAGLRTTVTWLPEGLLAVAPLVTSLVALIAIGLAPVLDHRRSTLARMMLVFGLAEGFLATHHPLALAALWAASAIVTWAELRSWSGEARWHRVFGMYQLLSILMFTLGAVLVWRGQSSTLATAALLAGIGLREGVVPVHSWFVRFVERAPMGVVVAFVAPQLGIYAQLSLLKGGVGEMADVVAAVGAFTAVMAALLGAVQTKARRAVAYLILSQTGLVAFGLQSETPAGMAGALLNWQVLALATSGFAMALAVLEARRGARLLTTPNGSFQQTPRLGVAFLILGFASVGFPLTLGFVAEDLLVQGAVAQFPLLSLSLVIATALNGVTVLRVFFYLFTGSKTSDGEPDLCSRESYVFGLVIALLMFFGLAPGAVIALDAPQGSGDPVHHSDASGEQHTPAQVARHGVSSSSSGGGL